MDTRHRTYFDYMVYERSCPALKRLLLRGPDVALKPLELKVDAGYLRIKRDYSWLFNIDILEVAFQLVRIWDAIDIGIGGDPGP